jgi:exonuclease SbcC
MRPLRLEVEGFTVFRQPVVVDFVGADLFALAGPTGAGKTSLIDAITFALYGSVPRLDDRRAVAPVVSQNLTEARVRLDFAVGGTTYTAVRVVRATKTGATTKEARLQQGDEVLAGNADEVGAAVVELLGLTFEHFTTCVSLPQGQFARFLHDKPRDRQDLLVRLLDLGVYDKVASLARQRAVLATNQVDVFGAQLERLAAATPEARSEAEARVALLAELAATMTAARPQLDALAERAQAARTEADRCRDHLARLRALRAPDGVAELAERLAAVARQREVCVTAEATASAALATFEAAVERLPARALLDAVHRDLVERVELEALVKTGEQAAVDAALAVDESRDAEQQAGAERDRCALQLEQLRIEHRAHALVPALRKGEPCPVCRQTVETIPSVTAPGVSEAEQHLRQAETRLKATTKALGDACTQQARVDEKLTRVRHDLTQITTRLAHATLSTPTPPTAATDTEGTAPAGALDAPRGAGPTAASAPMGPGTSDGAGAHGPVAGAEGAARVGARGAAGGGEELSLFADGTDGRGALGVETVEGLIDEVDTAEAAVAEARRADRAARTALADVDRQREQLMAGETAARRAFDAARDSVAVLDPPPAERADLASDWQGLLAWAEQRQPVLADEADAHGTTADAAEREAGERRAALVEACRGAGVEPPAPPAWPGEAVAAEHARADETVRRIEADLAEAERLRGEVQGATEDRQVAESLAGHLAANRFEKWLLDEAVHRLVSGASAILGELTGNAYALSVDDRSGVFTVVDHTNASQARSARTLSGGETFLASLALALALADQVAELAAAGTARLESLFLDEGFGTLDPDTLDVVATALDELGARGRMVGVVTHVRELAERLPTRFEVRKAGGTATVERVDT